MTQGRDQRNPALDTDLNQPRRPMETAEKTFASKIAQEFLVNFKALFQ